MLDNPKNITEIREEISDEELTSFAQAIKTRYGIDFTNYEKKSLKRGVARLITKHELGSLVGLWAMILKDREFFFSCIDDLLVNLTELFRNPEIWLRLKNDVLMKLKDKPALSIWHAGCSTGEEIYTMAIVLKDNGLSDKTTLLATDLSTQALEKAKKGRYSSMLWNKYTTSFQKYKSIGKLETYFEIGEDHATVKDFVKKNIEYQKHNLVQDSMVKKFDIIFCRNVMIYFDDVLKMKVLNLFHKALNKDGYFIIGYYDMLPEQSKDLFVLHDPVTRIYRPK